MGERSDSLYARRDTATKIDREPKTSSGADSRERPAPIPSGDINAGVHGSCEHSVHVERLHVVSSTTPHSLCAHDRIHHIPLEETNMSMSIEQVWKHTEYQRKMLTNAIMRYLGAIPHKDWTEEQKALWREMADVNNTSIEEYFGI